jgi:Lipocalin-like domain
MNRRSILTISAVMAFGLGLLPGGAFAQQKALKEQIVGTWSIASAFDQYEDGKKEVTFGVGVKGGFSFDGNGRFMWTIIGEKQAAMKSDDPRRPDAFTVALVGTYAVEGNVISIHIERGANSIRDGADQTLTVTGSGDSLTFTGSPRKDQKGTFSPSLEVVRAK